ncbi:hypothetical protein PMALA_069770 [Plasmodium malariae]|uniref:Secreted protein n=1 Tax=Plasmodium malariae TaxID=5858 RepID=A0A1A8X489_PLAMA|nr:hypothetical protein PMALA_069770 [Plasmodium malariae]
MFGLFFFLCKHLEYFSFVCHGQYNTERKKTLPIFAKKEKEKNRNGIGQAKTGICNNENASACSNAKTSTISRGGRGALRPTTL